MAVFEDEFNDESIDATWTQDTDTGGSITENASGRLAILAGTAGVGTATYAPCGVWQTISGDFDVYTKIIIPALTENAQQVGLIAEVDSNNFVKNTRWYYNGQEFLVYHIVTGSAYKGTAVANTSTTVWLRMKRVGSTFSCYYTLSAPSLDTDWTQLADPSTTLSSSANVKLWLHANTVGGTQFTGEFDFFRAWSEYVAPQAISGALHSAIFGRVVLD